MKKSVVIAAVFALVAAVSSFAAVSDPNASVTVNATVLPVLSVSVQNTSVSIPAILDTGGDISLGNVTFVSNYKSWKVAFSSLNGGKMVNTDNDVKDVITYTFYADGIISGRLTSEITKGFVAKTKKDGDQYGMAIKYDANAAADYLTSGIYSDTITITVSSN